MFIIRISINNYQYSIIRTMNDDRRILFTATSRIILP